MDNSYVNMQMDMHRVQELDEMLALLNEQKTKNNAALRRIRLDNEKSVYLCGGSFFQKVDKDYALKEIEDRTKRIEKNIEENRSEYELVTKKLHQFGIYGL